MRPLDNPPVHRSVRTRLLLAVKDEARGQLHSIKPNMEIPEKERAVDPEIPSVARNLQPQFGRQTISLEIDREEYQRRFDRAVADDVILQRIEIPPEHWERNKMLALAEVDEQIQWLKGRRDKLEDFIQRFRKKLRQVRKALAGKRDSKAVIERRKYRAQRFCKLKVARRRVVVAKMVMAVMEVEALKKLKRQTRGIIFTKKKS